MIIEGLFVASIITQTVCTRKKCLTEALLIDVTASTHNFNLSSAMRKSVYLKFQASSLQSSLCHMRGS